jgi:hypothetical protein
MSAARTDAGNANAAIAATAAKLLLWKRTFIIESLKAVKKKFEHQKIGHPATDYPFP